MLSLEFCVYFRVVSFLQFSPPKFYQHLRSAFMDAIGRTHVTKFDVITPVISWTVQIVNPLAMQFSSVPSYIVSLSTFSQCSSLNARDHVSHPHKMVAYSAFHTNAGSRSTPLFRLVKTLLCSQLCCQLIHSSGFSSYHCRPVWRPLDRAYVTT